MTTGMASPELTARLRYLNEAAHLVASSAPVSSAHLMSSCDRLLLEHKLEPSEAHRRQICGACGSILIVGRTANFEVTSTRSKSARASKHESSKRQSEMSSNVNAKAVAYTCKMCRRTTRHALPSAPKRTKNQSARPGNGQQSLFGKDRPGASAQAPLTTPSNLSANASSKKRSKSRKQGGLQALMEKNRASATSGPRTSFGLDLFDLMKKS